ncbi:MAG: chemotaxis protein CheW [Planctomycetes bacterium]|nr:chemotaxis protein CheW [Planctomycetota bacterium]
MKILRLLIGEKPYALPISFIREILEETDYTPVEKAPKDVLGLMNVRGQIVTVLSPAASLHCSDSKETSHKRIIILKRNSDLPEQQHFQDGQEGTAEDLYAFQVDKIGEVVEINEDQLKPIPGNTPEFDATFLTAIARIGDEVIPVLHLKNIILQEKQEERAI